ncbi:hypothetical protein BGZ57DRAFT_777807, partial [Hyaloscypha finlandica]
LIYIGNELKSYKEQIGYFYHISKIRDYIKHIYLKGIILEEAISYYYPLCKSQGLVLKHLQYFKSHVQTVHGVSLRE